MKSDYIPKVITLLAGAVVCIVTIVKDMNVTYSLEILLATLIIFYIIGLIAKKIFQKIENSNRIIQQKRDEELEMQRERDRREGERRLEEAMEEANKLLQEE